MERLRFVPAPPTRDRRRVSVGLGAALVGGAFVLALGAWASERAREPPAPPPAEPASAGALLERLGLRRAPAKPGSSEAVPAAAPVRDGLAELREAAVELDRARTIACERLARARATDADPRAIDRLARAIGPCTPITPANEPAPASAPEGRAL